MNAAFRTTAIGGLCWLGILVSSPASAAALAPFSGYSEFGTACDLCDSFVNFSVYQSTDGNWTDDLFFTSGSAPTPLADLGGQWTATVDVEAPYVYLYQIVNNDPASTGFENPLRNFNISRRSLPTSAGYFATTVFRDLAGNNVTNSPDFSLADPDPALGNPDTPNDGVPSLSGTVPQGIFNAGVGVNPAGVRSDLLMASPNVAAGVPFSSIIWDWGLGTEIPPGDSSSVLFLTSNLPPTYRWAETESPGGFGAAGDVPAPVPEPTTWLLFATGLLGLLGLSRVYRRTDVLASR